jgi:hypothetical protein
MKGVALWIAAYGFWIASAFFWVSAAVFYFNGNTTGSIVFASMAVMWMVIALIRPGGDGDS